ncbi:MAG: hypothetical protein L0387_04510 [Acidobacteria bacterium]|nr:hypothetical protein [Acidobacteriota bacterium]MCI0723583.1 hypothetical protein [Acidobacteriota bacterium]
MTKYTYGIIAMLLLAEVSFSSLARYSAPREKPLLGPVQKVMLGKVHAQAEIVYHSGSHIYVMNRKGQNVAQITFENPRRYEHAAVSYDHRFIVANEQKPNPERKPGGVSLLWLFDLEKATETQLVPQFDTAGNGGVDWDRNGFVYFGGKERDVVLDPKRPEDFTANAAANDVYKIRFDGTGLQRLTNTKTRGESDVSVSEDGTLVTFNDLAMPEGVMEIWVINSDGSNPRRVYAGGKPGVDSVHDPELSPDNTRVVFSRPDPKVPPNFPNNPVGNTAHDVWAIGRDGTGLKRLTRPGPISIIPDWKEGVVVYTELSEKDNYLGASIVRADGQDQVPERIKPGVNSPKWIP